MTAKHTPGPWLATLGGDIRGSLGRRFKIATVLTPHCDSEAAVIEAVETRANACLIAAAPDLLAALPLLKENLGVLTDSYADEVQRTRTAIVVLKTAIAKATP